MMQKTVIVCGLLGAISMILLGCAIEPPPPAPIFDAVEATPTRQLSMALENIQVAARYPLEVEGEILQDNPWQIYEVPLFSPDGTMMLFRKRVVGGSELWLTASQQGTAQRLLEKVWGYVWSPDGKWIAYTQSFSQGGASLWVMSADGSEKRKMIERIKTGQVQWLDENQLVYIASNGSIMSVGRDSHQVTRLVPPLISSVNQFALSPDGERVVLSDEAEVWLIDLRKPEELINITPYDGAFWGSVAWSPDGNWVAYSSQSEIYLVDKDGTSIIAIPSGWYPHALAWSPDGRILASIGRVEQRGFSYEIYLTAIDSKTTKRLTHDNENTAMGEKYTLTWVPDAHRLIYGTSRLPTQKIEVIELNIQ